MSTQKNEHNPETELKPCPFCGGNASYHSRFDVKCGICGAEINSLNPTETWNRRITPPTDTTGSGREGETPETDAIWCKLMAALGKAGIHPKEANDAFGILAPIRQLERQRDAALAQVEALRRDGERMDWLETLLKKSKRYWPLVHISTLPSQMMIGACNTHHGSEAGLVTEPTLRAAIDSAQRQEGIK